MLRAILCSGSVHNGKVHNFERRRQPTLRVELSTVSSAGPDSGFKQYQGQRHPRIRDAIEPCLEAPNRIDDGGSA